MELIKHRYWSRSPSPLPESKIMLEDGEIVDVCDDKKQGTQSPRVSSTQRCVKIAKYCIFNYTIN